jgi:hypothetical protein
MRRSSHHAPLLLLAAALASLPWVTLPASAGGLGLRWNACGGDGGVQNRSFACNTNTGTELLVASFVLTSGIANVEAIESRIDLKFAVPPQPAWWDFKTLGCRATALSFRGTPPVAATCADWGESGAIGLVAPLPSMPSLQVQSYLPVAPVDLVAGQEYFAFSLLVSHQKTVGATSCAGCSERGCLSLQYVEIEDSAGIVTTVGPSGSLSQDWLATWQAPIGGQPCPFIGTPTRRSTWSTVKSLYR